MRFEIKHTSLPFLEKKLQRIQRAFRAQRGDLTWEVVESHIANISYDSTAFGPDYTWNTIPIGVDTIEITGTLENTEWKVIGIAYKQENGEVTVKTIVPNIQIPHEYYNNTIKCDHCHTAARRKKGVIIQNNITNEFKMVGSGCLQEYTGISLQALESLYGFEETVVEEANTITERAFGYNEFIYNTTEVLAVASAISYRLDPKDIMTRANDIFRVLKESSYLLYYIHYPTSILNSETNPQYRMGRGVFMTNNLDGIDPSSYEDEAIKIKEWIKSIDLEAEYENIINPVTLKALDYEPLHNKQVLAHQNYIKTEDVSSLAKLSLYYRYNVKEKEAREAKEREEQAAREAERQAQEEQLRALSIGNVGDYVTIAVKDIKVKAINWNDSVFYSISAKGPNNQPINWTSSYTVTKEEGTITGKIKSVGPTKYQPFTNMLTGVQFTDENTQVTINIASNDMTFSRGNYYRNSYYVFNITDDQGKKYVCYIPDTMSARAEEIKNAKVISATLGDLKKDAYKISKVRVIE